MPRTLLVWKKLVRVNKSNSRNIQISKRLIEEAGLNPEADLVGKWTVWEKGKHMLVLEIKEDNQEFTQNIEGDSVNA